MPSFLPDFYCKCQLFHLGIVVAGVDDCDGGGDAVVVAVAVVFCVVIAGEKSRSCKGKTFQKCPIKNEKKLCHVNIQLIYLIPKHGLFCYRQWRNTNKWYSDYATDDDVIGKKKPKQQSQL